MKKLQTSYNNHANKIIKQATQEKGTMKNLNFSVNLAMVSNDIKLTLDEPNHPNKESCRKQQEDIHSKFMDMNKQQIYITIIVILTNYWNCFELLLITGSLTTCSYQDRFFNLTVLTIWLL